MVETSLLFPRLCSTHPMHSLYCRVIRSPSTPPFHHSRRHLRTDGSPGAEVRSQSDNRQETYFHYCVLIGDATHMNQRDDTATVYNAIDHT